MKKLLAVSLALALVFSACTATAATKAVNLMEFARRYYHAMDIIGAETNEPLIDYEPSVKLDYNTIYYNEAGDVTGVFLYVPHDDKNKADSASAILIALSTPYEEIDRNSFSSEIISNQECGDYKVTLETNTDSGMTLILRLK